MSVYRAIFASFVSYTADFRGGGRLTIFCVNSIYPFHSDSVLVHIIDEGKIPPAAVYGDSSSTATSAFYQTWTLILCFEMFL